MAGGQGRTEKGTKQERFVVVHEGGKREKKRGGRGERADGTYLPETKGVWREEGGVRESRCLPVWMGQRPRYLGLCGRPGEGEETQGNDNNPPARAPVICGMGSPVQADVHSPGAPESTRCLRSRAQKRVSGSQTLRQVRPGRRSESRSLGPSP